ncbi:Uncharacterised protein [Vibrio cholerae]|nr:Uncharacterised protein [Vibrio cholerae]CSI50412.1 Uncharacterised protein [Vibrio cholerae]
MMLNVVCTSVSWLTCRLMNCVQCRINPWARYVSRSLTMKICVMHCVSRKITHALSVKCCSTLPCISICVSAFVKTSFALTIRSKRLKRWKWNWLV